MDRKSYSSNQSPPPWKGYHKLGWIGTVCGSFLLFYISKTNNSEPVYFSYIPDTCLLYPTVINLIWNNDINLIWNNDFSCMREYMVSHFCKDLTNIVYLLSKNKYLAIFRFEINPKLNCFQILHFWLGWIGTALLAMRNPLLGSDFRYYIFLKCPMIENDKMNHHNNDDHNK